MSNIKKIIDALTNVALTLEHELQQEHVSQARAAALRRLMSVHRKELSTELTDLQNRVPKMARAPRAAAKQTKGPKATPAPGTDMSQPSAASQRARSKASADPKVDSADSTPADFDDGESLPGKQPSDVPTE